MRSKWVNPFAVLLLLLCGFLAISAIVRTEARPLPPAQANAPGVTVGATDIGGVVTSSKGPEAGVWVIAEQVNSSTKFAKIVVTDDQGRYLVPDLPKGNYRLWVRGYGLVDSKPLDSTTGKTVALTAVLAPNARAAAEYYPAAYWASLLKIPTKSEFPMKVPPAPPLEGAPDPVKDTHADTRANDPPPPDVITNQGQWLSQLKGCWTCHQMGLKSTREIPASLNLPQDSPKSWERLISSGQVGRGMMGGINLMGHDRTLAMYADWGGRIAKGELPPVPPRPVGTERNVVITMWNWAVPTAFLHAMISTDRRKPTVNAYGSVYGADWSGDCGNGKKKVTCLAVLDPKSNESFEVPVPLPNEADREKLITWSPQTQLAPSPYYGNELPWNDPVNPGPITMDAQGRVWFNVETRIGNPDYCKAGSNNPFAKASPRESGGKGVDVYDPKTGKFGFVDLCFESTRIIFSNDKDNTLYFSVQRDGGIGWLNVNLWDKTHDAEKSQGWCAPAAGIPKPGAYGVAYNTVDDSFWYSNLQIMPGRLIRMTRGSNPPATCQTEVYEVPYDAAKGIGGNQTRGIDVDSKGVVWSPLQAEGILASLDRKKCKTIPTGKDAISGKACPEGWTFTPIPGPVFKSDPTIKSDNNYYMFIDKYNSLGLGNDVVIVDGANSDSLIAYKQDTKEWVRMRVPYRMGFFSRFFDARVDDPNAGWKGRGAYAANQTRGSWLTEGGKGTPSQLYHFQVRPDPLAR